MVYIVNCIQASLRVYNTIYFAYFFINYFLYYQLYTCKQSYVLIYRTNCPLIILSIDFVTQVCSNCNILIDTVKASSRSYREHVHCVPRAPVREV